MDLTHCKLDTRSKDAIERPITNFYFEIMNLGRKLVVSLNARQRLYLCSGVSADGVEWMCK